MKLLVALIFLLAAGTAPASVNTYSSSDGRLYAKNVSVDGTAYSSVVLTLRRNGNWTVDAATPGADYAGAEYPFVTYDSGSGSATFPTLDVDGATLENVRLTLDPDGGWELVLSSATPAPVTPTNLDYSGIWANDEQSLKFRLAQKDGSVTLTNLRSGLVMQGPLSGNVASLIEDDSYLRQSITLTLSSASAVLHIDSCQPRASFCSRSVPVGSSIVLYKQ